MTISRDSPAAMQAAAKANKAVARDLRTIREQQGDEAALGHANGAMVAAAEFVAFDLNQPAAARATVDSWAQRLAVTLPTKPAESPPDAIFRGPEAAAAKWAEDLTSNLWEAQRLFDPKRSTLLADATVRATLRFLVETYQVDHARELVEGLQREIDGLIAARDAVVTAPRQ